MFTCVKNVGGNLCHVQFRDLEDNPVVVQADLEEPSARAIRDNLNGLCISGDKEQLYKTVMSLGMPFDIAQEALRVLDRTLNGADPTEDKEIPVIVRALIRYYGFTHKHVDPVLSLWGRHYGSFTQIAEALSELGHTTGVISREEQGGFKMNVVLLTPQTPVERAFELQKKIKVHSTIIESCWREYNKIADELNEHQLRDLHEKIETL